MVPVKFTVLPVRTVWAVLGLTLKVTAAGLKTVMVAVPVVVPSEPVPVTVSVWVTPVMEPGAV